MGPLVSPPSKFEELAAALAAENQRRQPTDIWIEECPAKGPFTITFGATYDDGRGRVALGTLDKGRYRNEREWKDALVGAFIRCGIDVNKVAPNAFAPNQQQQDAEAEARRKATMQAFAEALANSGFFRGAFNSYSEAFFTPGSAYADAARYQRGPQGDMFRRPKEPDPERKKAIERCRDLKRMIDNAAAYPGEKANAQAAMDRTKAKHGIADHEI